MLGTNVLNQPGEGGGQINHVIHYKSYRYIIHLERSNGDMVGMEVKASESVGPDDAKSLSKLKAIAGERFKRGLVIYAGAESVPLGANIWATPVAWLRRNV